MKDFSTPMPVNFTYTTTTTPSITLRQYYAAAAMQGLLANPSVDMEHSDFHKFCFEHADAMIDYDCLPKQGE